jgi:cytochrome c551/c552
MKKVLFTTIAAGSILLYACGGGEQKPISGTEPNQETSSTTTAAPANDGKGVGKFTNVDISPTLNFSMAASGESIAKIKCLSCHKLSEEKLVGPGWKDVTKRRKPEWTMNFITNTEEMLNKDPEAQKGLEICLVRMPNQNLTDEEARQVLEFMRKNDGIK